ncbi:hypothetical protein AB0M02_22375 [Actinoplanes sp. NPDC051861]|uniref:hypothetical protein n=1 Tax=Actinoplanes sp. NPDC051861 TaxID=3155170 RepID=UPI00341AD54A
MVSRCLTGVCAAGLVLTVLTGCGSDRNPAPEAAAAGEPVVTSVPSPIESPTATPSSPSPSPSPSATTSATKSPDTSSAKTPDGKTPGTSTSRPKPATLRQLRKIVVRQADLPSGWEPIESISMLTPEVNAAMAKCIGVRDTTPHMVAGAESKAYFSGQSQIQSVAASYRGESDLDVDYGMLTNPRMKLCLERLVRFVQEELGGTVDSVTTKVTLDPPGYPSNVVAVVEGRIEGDLAGLASVQYDRTVYIRGPLLQVQVGMASVDEPVPGDILDAVVDEVAARAGALG